eukprot:scaffold71014_cov32-Tisochrysis_lutea.AAC.1
MEKVRCPPLPRRSSSSPHPPTAGRHGPRPALRVVRCVCLCAFVPLPHPHPPLSMHTDRGEGASCRRRH